MELLLVWLVSAGVTAVLVYGFFGLCVLASPVVGPGVQALACLGPVAGIPVLAVSLASALGPAGVDHPILVALLTTPLAVVTGALILNLDNHRIWDVLAIPLGAAAIGVETVVVTVVVDGIASVISHLAS